MLPVTQVFIMQETDETPKRDKRKFKQTKQLVKTALGEGWTQKQIATACRTQQSVVSSWASGARLATESQLKPLLDQFGNKIRRNSFRLYQAVEDSTLLFSKVEGRIIFSQTLNCKNCDREKKKKHSKIKFTIHDQGKSMLRLVSQSNMTLQRSEESISFNHSHCDDDSRVWLSRIYEPMLPQDILKTIDSLSEKHFEDYKEDAWMLRIAIRESLLVNGYSIEGIVDYPAAW